ncbi:STAS domain-containing protein [Desulfolutivibrio sulfoxidireducens]|uniref:STAS domain-containing protein n=1 Tax=Desulfolutivibrio sulfoxidireducens TaxID=2773299 RepID=UPI001FECAD57|nr:STAS domain-containing protein [Desulfolutivibrio sulfoxidireducens]
MTEMKRNTAEGESWTWSESPRTNTVRICGEIDFTVSPVVRDKLVAFIEQTRGDVFLDLGELDYVDSSGLAALIEGRKILKAKGRKITITAVSRQVRKLFELTQIGDLFGL